MQNNIEGVLMEKEKIVIITDSTNDLPLTLREQYGILVVPLTIVWGESQYLDGVELSGLEFYEKLKDNPIHPTTSQPTPGSFLEAFEAAKSGGATQIMVCVISSAMSGTIESARLAAEGYSLPVSIWDSKSNSMSLGWQVLAMARTREKGGGIEEMRQSAEKVRANLHYHIVLDTLDYLIRGGRIGSAARLIGNVLKIKPQIRVNHQSGSVEPGDISTTRKKAIESLYTSFFKKVDTSKPMHIAVLHNGVEEDAMVLTERVKMEFNPKELITGIVSPVLGAHTGPGAIALCGYSES
jgi:DegV family protein with EDD domain